MRSSRLGLVAAAVLTVLAYGTADALDRAPGVLTVSATPRPAPAAPTPSDPPRAVPAPALPSLSPEAPRPAPAGVVAALGTLLRRPALGPRVSAVVVDPASRQVLLDDEADLARVPASTAKLLTGAAVLTTVGGDTRLRTRVLRGSGPDEVVLVGAGDTLLGTGESAPRQILGRAGLSTLAAQVAGSLRAQGRRRVAVRFDDSLFAGPTASPLWGRGDLAVGLTGRVSALGLARDRPHPGSAGPADPSLSAARAFATALARQGVSVAGDVARTRAVADAPVLGQVESAPVADLLALALTDSDNAQAEVLARLVAREMGRPTTFLDSGLAVLDQVQSLGIDTGPTRVVDGSGLGRGSAAPARVLADLLVLASSDRDPRLRPLLTGLPVAGFSGTLADRYTGARTRAAAGLVRAKTGTLAGVSSIAGVTVDADGRLLVFVVLADQVPAGGTSSARVALDQVAAALTACGCR